MQMSPASSQVTNTYTHILMQVTQNKQERTNKRSVKNIEMMSPANYLDGNLAVFSGQPTSEPPPPPNLLTGGKQPNSHLGQTFYCPILLPLPRKWSNLTQNILLLHRRLCITGMFFCERPVTSSLRIIYSDTTFTG